MARNYGLLFSSRYGFFFVITRGKKMLCEVAGLAVLWCIWLGSNARIFKRQFQPIVLVGDKILFFASLWLKAHDFFVGLV